MTIRKKNCFDLLNKDIAKEYDIFTKENNSKIKGLVHGSDLVLDNIINLNNELSTLIKTKLTPVNKNDIQSVVQKLIDDTLVNQNANQPSRDITDPVEQLAINNAKFQISAKELKRQNPIEYFNILTKEVYEKVKQSSTYFPHPEVQGQYRDSEAELITQLLDITGRISQDPGISPLGAIKQQAEVIENFARRSGFFFESTAEFEHGTSKSGMESVVWQQKDGKSVVKISSPELNNDWHEFIYNRFVLHNLYFPNTAYNFVGVTKKGDRMYMLLSQRGIPNEHEFTSSLNPGWGRIIKDWFEQFGFSINDDTTIEAPDGTIITDLHPGNVFLFEGQLYVIDPSFPVEGTGVDIMMDEILSKREDSGTQFQIFSDEIGARRLNNDTYVVENEGAQIKFKEQLNPITGAKTRYIEFEIESQDKGKGFAKDLLGYFVGMADRNKQALYLTISPKTKDTDPKKLEQLYTNHGFKKTSDFEMVREPRRGQFQITENDIPNDIDNFPEGIKKTLKQEYAHHYAHGFDWNDKSREFTVNGVYDGEGFRKWLKNYENEQLTKNIDKLIRYTRQDLLELLKRKNNETILKNFEELILPVLGTDIETEALSKYLESVVLITGIVNDDPEYIQKEINKAFIDAKNIIDEDGSLDYSKITPSTIFTGGEVSLPNFERFVEKNPEYKGVFEDWKKLFYKTLEYNHLHAFRDTTPYNDIKNLHNFLVGFKNNITQFQIVGTGYTRFNQTSRDNLHLAIKTESELGLTDNYWDKPKPRELSLMQKIRHLTGWERGKDGYWRYEIDDLTDSIAEMYEGRTVGELRTTADKLVSPELKQAYPSINKVEVVIDIDPTAKVDGTLEVVTTPQGKLKNMTISILAPTMDDAQIVLIHEIQHFVQYQEGFSLGGNKESLKDAYAQEYQDAINSANPTEALAKLDDKFPDGVTPKAAYEYYMRMAGEIEADNAVNRMKFSKEDKLRKLLYETEDKPRQEQTLRFTEENRMLPTRVGIEITDRMLKSGESFTQTYQDLLDEIFETTGYTPTFRAVEHIEDEVKFQIAWHGTPYNVDRFSLDKIGTGEGNQTFGWGLYFTDLEDIAKMYARSGVINKKYSFDGLSSINDISLHPMTKSFVRDMLKSNPSSREDAINWVKNNSQGKSERVITELNNLASILNIDNSITRNLLKVSLHEGKTPDQYTWLEWDKSVPKNIIDKIQKQADKEFADTYIGEMFDEAIPYFKDSIGQDIYLDIVRIFGRDPETASKFLLRAGIDGNKYPSETLSRGATSETTRGSNYVVFDENAITIKEKVQFQIESEVTPEVINKLGIQLNKEGYQLDKYAPLAINRPVGALRLPIGSTGTDLYENFLLPLLKTRDEVVNFLGRAGIKMDVPHPVQFQIASSLPEREIRSIILDGLQNKYSPEMIRNEIIKLYQIKTKAGINELDGIFESVYNSSESRGLDLKKRRSVLRSFRRSQNGYDFYVAETIDDITTRWRGMNAIDKAIVKDAMLTNGEVGAKIQQLILMEELGQEETPEYEALHTEVKIAMTDRAKGLNMAKMFSDTGAKREEMLDRLAEKYGRKLPTAVKAKFKELFKEERALRTQISINRGVLPQQDIVEMERKLENTLAQIEVMYRQFNPASTSWLQLFGSMIGNLFKPATLAANALINTVNTVIKGGIMSPLTVYMSVTGGTAYVSFRDLYVGLIKSIPYTKRNIVESYKKGSYTPASGDEVGGVESNSFLRYFHPLVEAIKTVYDLTFTDKTAQEIAEKNKLLLKNGKITAKDVFIKFIAGTTGATSDIMLRTLVTGDVPFSNASYFQHLRKLGRQDGLTGAGLNKFLDNPPSWAHDIAVQESKVPTYTQEGFIPSKVGKVKSYFKREAMFGDSVAGRYSAGAGYIAMSLIMPFTHVPLNFIMHLLKLSNPGLYMFDLAEGKANITGIKRKLDKEKDKSRPNEGRIKEYNKQIRSEQDRIKLALYSMASAIVVKNIFRLAAQSGAFYSSGDDDDRKNIRKNLRDRHLVNSLNVTQLIAFMNRDMSKRWLYEMDEKKDVIIKLDKLSTWAFLPLFMANTAQEEYFTERNKGNAEKTPAKAFDMTNIFTDLGGNMGIALEESVQLSFIQSVGKLFNTVTKGDENKVAAYLTDLLNTFITYTMFPNTAVGVQQARRDYIPANNRNLGAENDLGMNERVERLIESKFNIKGSTITDWAGRDIKPVPEDYFLGTGMLARLHYHNLSVYKTRQVSSGSKLDAGELRMDLINQYLLDVTGKGVFPLNPQSTTDFPTRLPDKNNRMYDLTVDQIDRYKKEMGAFRLAIVRSVMSDPGFKGLVTMVHPHTPIHLNRLDELNSKPSLTADEKKEKSVILEKIKDINLVETITDDSGNIIMNNWEDAFVKGEITNGRFDTIINTKVREIIQKTVGARIKDVENIYDQYFFYNFVEKDEVSDLFLKGDIEREYRKPENIEQINKAFEELKQEWNVKF